MKRVSPLPTLLTLGNFACGFAAVAFCCHALRIQPADLEQAERFIKVACGMIFVAMVFDLLDGRVARLTGSASRFGGELDSLADACSFGLAPAMILTTLWLRIQPSDDPRWLSQAMGCGLVYAACAVLRLARYNVEMDVKAKSYFHGLPSPGAAGAAVSAILFARSGHLDWLWQSLVIGPADAGAVQVAQVRFLGVYLLILGVLMVTRLRFAHLANRFLGGRKRLTSVVAFIFAFAVLLSAPEVTIFVCFNAYVLLGLLGEVRYRLGRPRGDAPGEDEGEAAVEAEGE